MVDLGIKLCLVLSQEARLYAHDKAPAIRLEDASFTRVIDRTNGLPGYEGVWRDARAQKCGSLTLNSDGSYYGEFDLLVPQPGKPLLAISLSAGAPHSESKTYTASSTTPGF